MSAIVGGPGIVVGEEQSLGCRGCDVGNCDRARRH